ncbi:OmpA family protein, partial [Brucella abortus]|nr:OmpA family protein [Brucella abortus]
CSGCSAFSSRSACSHRFAEINPKARVEMESLRTRSFKLIGNPGRHQLLRALDGHTITCRWQAPALPRQLGLSSARATAVVKFLIANGVPANWLVAAGFGEYQPIDTANTADARARNRRIELKLTER